MTEVEVGLASFYLLWVVGAVYLGGDHVAGVFHGGDGLVVASAKGVGADLGHLFQHFHAVF